MILVDGQACEFVSALDRGLTYGDGVFRTMRADRGTVALWENHYRTLGRDCARLAIACPSEEELLADMHGILRQDPDCVVRIMVTRGRGGRGYAGFDVGEPTRVVASFPLPAERPGCDERGVRALWCSIRLAHQPALAGVKHLNRLENVLARREWRGSEIAEGLMRDVDGQVIAGTMSNVLIVEENRLVTPALDLCGVAGVQRERLLALAQRLGIECRIEQVSPERVLAAQQVYLINSVIGLWWLSDLAGRTWQRLELTQTLLTALRVFDA